MTFYFWPIGYGSGVCAVIYRPSSTLTSRLEFELQEKVFVGTVQVSPGLKSVCMQHFLLEGEMWQVVARFWREEKGQDIAEYAVMLAVILVIVVGTIRLIGSHANTVFSNVASSIQ